jgi:divalent metal cation (Fe/Co/Zn/Cd) transporter
VNGLARRALRLEYATLGWNVVGVVVLAVAAVRAGSAAAAGFGLDSAIEIAASLVVVWQLTGGSEEREERALRLIGLAFLAVAVYVTVQAVVILATDSHPGQTVLGIAWTALTVVAMLALARGKAVTGRELGNAVVSAEARVTLVDAGLAAAVLVGLVLNAAAGWWWADPFAGLVIVGYALREARHALAGAPEGR